MIKTHPKNKILEHNYVFSRPCLHPISIQHSTKTAYVLIVLILTAYSLSLKLVAQYLSASKESLQKHCRRNKVCWILSSQIFETILTFNHGTTSVDLFIPRFARGFTIHNNITLTYFVVY